MRVLQIVQKQQRRGAEIFAFELSEELRRQHIDVMTVYLYEYHGTSALQLHEGDVCLLGDETSPLETVPGVQPQLLRRILHEVRAFQPDIVQVNGARSIKYGAVAKRLAGRGRRWSLVYRNIDMPSFWNRRPYSVVAYRELVMPQVDGVVGVSRTSLRDAARLYRLKIPGVAIPNGVDTGKLDDAADREQFRQEHGVARHDVLLLFVGSLVRQKRPDRFLHVVQQSSMAMPQVKAWLVGDGPLRQELSDLAGRLGIAQHCTFWGYQDAIRDYIKAADLLVVSSDTDGIPAVVLEAGYLGVPAVATRVGGMAECIVHGETGMLVDEPFVEGLTSATVALGGDESARIRLGNGARRLVRNEFSIERVGERYVQFYRQIKEWAGRDGHFEWSREIVEQTQGS